MFHVRTLAWANATGAPLLVPWVTSGGQALALAREATCRAWGRGARTGWRAILGGSTLPAVEEPIVDDLELAYTSAVDLRRLIADRVISPVEVTEALLRRIEQVNPVVNAYVTVAADQALAAARTAEQAVVRGEPLGPLHGVPVSLKDLTPTAGIRTTYGSRLYADNVPAEDALEVARLKQAGAIVVGKTNTPEFGAGPNTLNALFGATRNPWSLERSAGGSSGGAAVALACGLGAARTGDRPWRFVADSGQRLRRGRLPDLARSGAALPRRLDV